MVKLVPLPLVETAFTRVLGVMFPVEGQAGQHKQRRGFF